MFADRFQRLDRIGPRISRTNMVIGLILLRVVHIFASVFWVGGGILTFGYIEPAVKATAPPRQRFLQYLLVQRRFSFSMGIASLLTVMAGIVLFWRFQAVFCERGLPPRRGWALRWAQLQASSCSSTAC